MANGLAVITASPFFKTDGLKNDVIRFRLILLLRITVLELLNIERLCAS